MSRLPAFTLLEALLALVLMAVLAAMAAMVLGDLRWAGSSIGDSFARDEALLRFCTAVRTDMERATRIHMDGEAGLRFEHAADTVRYVVVEGALIRKTDALEERFELGVASMEHVVEPGTNLIALWRIRFADQPRLPDFAFRKTYSPADRRNAPDADPSAH